MALQSALCDSLITGERAAAVSSSVSEPWVSGSAVYWLESRPAEDGRVTLVRWHDGVKMDLIPPPFSVRSRVNEYGGGGYAVGHDGIWFVNETDQSLCYVHTQGVTRVVCEAGQAYGDLIWDARRRRLICVSEVAENKKLVQQIVAVSLGGKIQVLLSGADFYAAPRLSPDGRQFVWLEWQSPNMPWDATQLFCSTVSETGLINNVRCVAGRHQDEALCQPEWSSDGRLWVVSDRTDWWNLYRVSRDGLIPVSPSASECAKPAFVFAQRCYAFPPEASVLLAQTAGGLWNCTEIGDMTRAPKGLEALTEVVGIHAGGAGTAVVGGGPEVVAGLYFRRFGEKRFRCLTDQPVLADQYAGKLTPTSLDFETKDGSKSHALYYPALPSKELEDSRRPVRVRCHGGPTGAAQSLFDPRILFWTTRGFGVVELNYRGSTGYGRQYRRAIYGNWGVVDVQDACALAGVLRSWADVDSERMVITGASAGGLTALLSLMGEASPYAAGVSQYGVTDLVNLVDSAIGFEACYGEHLIGPWPDAAPLYRQRSPLRNARELQRPVLFLQGTEDPVVPAKQSASMADALAQCGVPVALELFEGERHGFHKPESVARALEVELAFYVKVLKLNTPERLRDLRILKHWATGMKPA